MTHQIAVLFARADSIYKSFANVDVWDEARDARKWQGGCSLVAHPPCRAWSVLKWLAKPPPGAKELAPWAISQIRKWGGVLEHPLGSELWPFCRWPPAKGLPDAWGGWTLRVDQYHFGHRARKSTLLYICGCPPSNIPPKSWRPGEPLYVISASKRKRQTGATMRPEVSRAEREGTPPEFAEWLCEIARRCRRPRTPILGV